NNSAAGSVRIGPTPGPVAASLRAVLSTITQSESSRVLDPAFPGARYSSTRVGFGRPYRSPSGNHWIMSGAIDAATDRDEVMLLGGPFADLSVGSDGRFSFVAPLTGSVTGATNGAFFGNAVTDTAVQPDVLVRKGVTTPLGQDGGTTLRLGSLSLNSLAEC